MARERDLLGAPGALEILRLQVVEVRHHLLDGVDADDLARGIEVLVGNLLDILGGELASLLLALK